METTTFPENDDKHTHVYLPPNDSKQYCAHCNAADPTVQCEPCFLKVFDRGQHRTIFQTLYCSEKCRQEHMSTHRPACEEMRQLRRAGLIFRGIFQDLLERVFEEDILDILVHNNEVVADINDPLLNFDNKPFIFPWGKAPSKDAGLTLLMEGQCSEVLLVFRPLFNYLFSSIGQKVHEYKIRCKNERFAAVRESAWSDGRTVNTQYWHAVVVIATASQTKMVLDFSGHQFGWSDWIAPWGEYKKHRVSEVEGRKKVTFYDPDESIPENLRFDKQNKRIETIRLDIMEHCTHKLKAILDRDYGGLLEVLKLDDDAFDVAHGVIAERAHNFVEQKANELGA
ncbi:putative MYND-type zinc finger protein samB [Seiridium unicorne]|uniref:MYND-type zinc finger protein samB n=1 Tax=Seiridium unicorne TaxID=138068 RepID=A0ABR2UGC9_9PEZI